MPNLVVEVRVVDIFEGGELLEALEPFIQSSSSASVETQSEVGLDSIGLPQISASQNHHFQAQADYQYQQPQLNFHCPLQGQVGSGSGSGSGPGSRRKRQYTGVRQRNWGRWVAEISLPKTRTRVWLGTFHTAEEAATAYDIAAYNLRGDEAKLNFSYSDASFGNKRLHATIETKLHGLLQDVADGKRAKKNPSTEKQESDVAPSDNVEKLDPSSEANGSGLDGV